MYEYVSMYQFTNFFVPVQWTMIITLMGVQLKKKKEKHAHKSKRKWFLSVIFVATFMQRHLQLTGRKQNENSAI